MRSLCKATSLAAIAYLVASPPAAGQSLANPVVATKAQIQTFSGQKAGATWINVEANAPGDCDPTGAVGSSYEVCGWNGTSWEETGFDGDTVGPASASDNSVATYNGTSGKLLQDQGAVFITDAGRLGVGTGSPANQLEIVEAAAGAAVAIKVENSSATTGHASVDLSHADQEWRLRNHSSADDLRFIDQTAGVAVVRLEAGAGADTLVANSTGIKVEGSGGELVTEIERTDAGAMQLRITTTANTWAFRSDGAGALALRDITAGKDWVRVSTSGTVRLEPHDAPGACGAGAKGAIYYDASLSELCDCDGSSWAQVDGGGGC